jgi:glycerophosphoryl diester phosphodiesterase
MRIVTHRGIGTGMRENSLVAFAAAIAQGATMVELDLRCTLDGQLVLAHNKHMGAWGRPDIWIPTHSYADLQRIAGDNDAGLDTFAGFIARFPNNDTILDIKWRGGMETLHALHAYVSRHLDIREFVRSHALLVWLPEHLVAAHALFPGIRIVDHRISCAKAIARAIAGLKETRTAMPRIVSIPAQCFRTPALARRIVTHLRTSMHTLMAYLPKSPAEVAVACSLAVDLMMTDDFSLTQVLAPASDVDVIPSLWDCR